MKNGMQGVGSKFLALAASIASSLAPSSAQVPALAPQHDWNGVSHVMLPQTRAFALERGRDPIVIERIEARVEIVEQAAVTTLELGGENVLIDNR